MWRFTQNRIVIRKDISTVVKVPAEEVKEILEQMARLKINKGWEFTFDNDQEFLNRHPEVVQRQQMLWDAKFQQLSKTLKISKADMDRKAKSDELAAASCSSSPEKPKRRRTVSRSRTKSAGSGMSDVSDGETEREAPGRGGGGERARRDGEREEPAGWRRRAGPAGRGAGEPAGWRRRAGPAGRGAGEPAGWRRRAGPATLRSLPGNRSTRRPHQAKLRSVQLKLCSKLVEEKNNFHPHLIVFSGQVISIDRTCLHQISCI